MRFLSIFFCVLFAMLQIQGCGMVNYAKANRIKQEITAEKEKAAGLDKRYQNENRKFIKLKDSIQRYNNLILTGKNAK